jgi:hypothetical protein
MWLLDRIFRSKLTEEEAYKEKTWQQLEILVASALKGKPDELAKVKAKALKEIDEQIYYAKSVGKLPQQMEDERVAEMNRQIENRPEKTEDTENDYQEKPIPRR